VPRELVAGELVAGEPESAEPGSAELASGELASAELDVGAPPPAAAALPRGLVQAPAPEPSGPSPMACQVCVEVTSAAGSLTASAEYPGS
jgi:hypothetical protein